MSWMLLILGVLAWSGAHLFKRMAPSRRAAMGDKGKAVVALGSLAGIVLMVIGFRATPFVNVWYPPSFMVHINNLLMLIAIYMMSPGPKKGALFTGMRHPQLTGFSLWAVAHLLVNGDLAAIILFGGLLVWAQSEVPAINKAEPDWTPGAKGKLVMDVAFLAASAVLLVIIAFIHNWLGVGVFPV